MVIRKWAKERRKDRENRYHEQSCQRSKAAESAPWNLARSQVSPRSQSSSSAGNYLYQQSARHFSRCSALNMALNLLESSQAKYMLWVKFVPGAVLGHSSRSAHAVPIGAGTRCPGSLSLSHRGPSHHYAKAGPNPWRRWCWNIQQSKIAHT